MSTRERWNTAWSALGAAPPSQARFDDLLSRYAESHRAYHTMNHIRECFEQFDAAYLPPHRQAQSLAEHPAEVELAIWFHDAIYDTRRSDNEEESAELAARSLLEAGAPPESSGRVRDLVLATRHNASPCLPPHRQATGRDVSLLVDIDLSILGAEPARFDEYEAQVRQEYSWVCERAFREGRSNILRGFLARPHIYATGEFRARLEGRARANLERSLSKLGA